MHKNPGWTTKTESKQCFQRAIPFARQTISRMLFCESLAWNISKLFAFEVLYILLVTYSTSPHIFLLLLSLVCIRICVSTQFHDHPKTKKTNPWCSQNSLVANVKCQLAFTCIPFRESAFISFGLFQPKCLLLICSYSWCSEMSMQAIRLDYILVVFYIAKLRQEKHTIAFQLELICILHRARKSHAFWIFD